MDHNNESEKGCSEKIEHENTSTSRQQSVSIDMEDIPEYKKKSCEKQNVLAKKVDNKMDKKMNSKYLFKRNYFVYAFGAKMSDYEPETRNGFVAKVFLIVGFMLIINAVAAAAVRYTPFLADLVNDNPLIVIVVPSATMAIIMAINYGMLCFGYMTRPPCTWIILIIACICYTLVVAVVTLKYQTELICIGLATTAIVVFFCFLLALTNIDFTKCAAFAGVMVIAVIVASVSLGVLRLCGFYMKPIHMAILAISIVVICLVLIIQLQMILGGKTIEISEDDVALPSYLVYTSVITLFLQILSLLDMFDD